MLRATNGPLGCLDEIEVFVTGSCRSPRVCDLTGVVDIEFNRILDEVSEATVTVAISGQDCCGCLGDVWPWCHELHIARNGEIVWEGPIVAVDYQFDRVIIEAQDVLGWLDVRVPPGVLDNSPQGTNDPMEITDLMEQVLKLAFAEEDPACVLRNIIKLDVEYGQRPTRFANTVVGADDYPAVEGTYLDWLLDLSAIGGDFTTIGSTVVFGVENYNNGHLGILTDTNIISNISVKKEGRLMANRFYVRYTGDDDLAQCSANCKAGNNGVDCPLCSENGNVRPCVLVPCPALSEDQEADRRCHLVERIRTDATGFNLATAQQAADLYYNAARTSPIILDFPEGARLSPDTPFDINDIIPGQIIDVVLSDLCFPVEQSFKILELRYRVGTDGNEEVALTLGPLNSIGQ